MTRRSAPKGASPGPAGKPDRRQSTGRRRNVENDPPADHESSAYWRDLLRQVDQGRLEEVDE